LIRDARPRSVERPVIWLNPLDDGKVEQMKDSPLMKRLVWSGLLAGCGALSSLAATRVATIIWKRTFGEEPPE
jgi:hypothetical protein